MTNGGADGYLRPESRARMRIDEMLSRAGWVVQDYQAVNLYAATGVAVRELPTASGPADYILFVDRQAVGAIEAKKQGTTLTGVEWQTVKYQSNVPDELPSVKAPDGLLPFGYESTGDETWFTCRYDPEPTARRVYWFHTPETLAEMVDDDVDNRGGSLRDRLQYIEPLPPWSDANVLFFERKPGAETAWTKDLWIYDLRTNQHFTLKQNPLTREALDDFADCYQPGALGKRKETERFKKFTYDEIVERDKASLDIFWLRDESLEDTDNLPAPEVIAAEIVEDLRSALEEFEALAESLAARGIEVD